eukprot:31499-Pelagococcus_subviridis.AAC.25
MTDETIIPFFVNTIEALGSSSLPPEPALRLLFDDGLRRRRRGGRRRRHDQRRARLPQRVPHLALEPPRVFLAREGVQHPVRDDERGEDHPPDAQHVFTVLGGVIRQPAGADALARVAEHRARAADAADALRTRALRGY